MNAPSLAALILLGALPACASYSELANERDAWTPRSSYIDPLPAAAIAPAAPIDTSGPGAIPGAEPAAAATFSTVAAESLLSAPSRFSPVGSIDPGLRRQTADPAFRETALSSDLGLTRYQTLAFLISPPVLAAERNARAAMEGYAQARDLSDLLSRYSAFTGEGQDAAMAFPAPGAAAYRGRIVEAEVKQAVAGLEAARRDAVAAAARAFRELAYNHSAQAAAGTTARRLGQLATSVAARYQAGEAEMADLADAEGTARMAAAELVSLREEQRGLEARVRAVLGLPPSAPVAAVPPPPEALPEAKDVMREIPPLAELERRALERRPELLSMRAEAEKMELMLQMGRRETYPGFSQNLSLSDNRFLVQSGSNVMEEAFPAARSLTDMQGRPAGAGYGIEAAYLREMVQRLASLREEIRGEEGETVAMVREAWTAFDRARREYELYDRDLVPLARLSRDSALRGYEAGKGALSRAVAALNADLAASLARERRRADLGIALAELVAAAGGPWSSAKETQP